MNKHTPGPWAVFCDEDGPIGERPGIDSCTEPRRTIIVYSDTNHFADSGICGETYEERIANARLIAAAPDLLDALIKLEEETWAPIPDEERFLRMRNIARAAIAKAEEV